MLSRVQIKTIHSLRHKKYREKCGRFLAEGQKIVTELLKGEEITVEEIFILDSLTNRYSSLFNHHKNLILTSVTEWELKQISFLETPQPVIALCKLPPSESGINLEGNITLMLESIRDPGNMGTIIRIADWFGIKYIICSPDCTDIFNPKVVQATMGSIARVKVSAFDLLPALVAHEKVPVYATTLKGKDINTFSKIKEGIILMGNESRGLSDQILEKADYHITIPRIGKAESLNVAVATGIICSWLL